MCNSTNNHIPAGMINFLYYYNQNQCIIRPRQTRNSINVIRPGRRANLLFLLRQQGKTSQLLSATIVFNSLDLRNKNPFQHLLLFFFSDPDPFSWPRTKTSRKVHAYKMLQFLIVVVSFTETVGWSDYRSYKPIGTQRNTFPYLHLLIPC